MNTQYYHKIILNQMNLLSRKEPDNKNKESCTLILKNGKIILSNISESKGILLK
jgi:hypothetical protein